MAKNTSILLGEHFDAFISNEIASGKYSSVSEVVRTALRLLEKEEQKMAVLRLALEAGEQSGIAEDFDPNNHLMMLRGK